MSISNFWSIISRPFFFALWHSAIPPEFRILYLPSITRHVYESQNHSYNEAVLGPCTMLYFPGSRKDLNSNLLRSLKTIYTAVKSVKWLQKPWFYNNVYRDSGHLHSCKLCRCKNLHLQTEKWVTTDSGGNCGVYHASPLPVYCKFLTIATRTGIKGKSNIFQSEHNGIKKNP